MNNGRNVLVVLSGPSGVGKGTIAKLIIENNENIALSVSCTTRAPREGEVDGRDYFFLKKEEFKERMSEGGFLEYSEHFGNFYGTPKDFVVEKLKKRDVLLEIDVNGGLKVKENFPEAVLIMLLPPSVDEIKRRLELRGTESEESIRNRMERINYEIGKKDFYDYAVVNDDLKVALKEIEEIIKNEKTKSNV